MSNLSLNKKTRGQKHDIVEEIHNHNILLESREIFIHGDFGSEEDPAVDFRMANKFLKNIRLLEQTGDHPIIVHQHSLGGFWDAGMIMYDAILHSPCHIIFIMHGTACSMGSIIPQAADTRIVMPNCTFMVHTGYTDIGGHTYKQSQSWAEMEKRQTEKMLDIYSGVAVHGSYFQAGRMDDKKVRKFLMSKMDQKEDWWLFAEDIVKYGFADAILGDKKYETIDTIRDTIINEQSS
jgi:ATP-dependent protease ClpP protease subunit